jgi:hypothetical protein
VDFLEVPIPEVALAQKVDCRNVATSESHHLIAEKDGVGVVMHVQVVNCQLVQSPQTLIPQHHRREVLQLCEVMLRVSAVVWLQQFCQKEYSVCFGGCEDGGLLGLFVHLNLN